MGWWKTQAGTIGDGPADRLYEALTPFPLAPVEAIAAAFFAALRRNPQNFASDPAAAGAAPAIVWWDGRQEPPGVAEPDLVDTFQDALEAVALDYLDSPLARRPKVSELYATLTFVIGPKVPTLDRIDVSEMPPQDADDQRIVLASGTSLAAVAGAVERAGLVRDADAVPQDPGRPAFASWSGAERDDREIDYHDRHGARWLEVRGRGAAALVAELTEALGARPAADPAAALARLVTGSRPRPDAPLGPTGRLRWQSLRSALATAVPETAVAVKALVVAGLTDPDWRVRMTAMLAVGRLGLDDLADAAMAAEVPTAGRDGLGQEDRRALLALRQAASDRARGAPPWGESDDPTIARRRRDYQARLHARLERPPAAAEDRADALLLALFGDEDAGARFLWAR